MPLDPFRPFGDLVSPAFAEMEAMNASVMQLTACDKEDAPLRMVLFCTDAATIRAIQRAIDREMGPPGRRGRSG